MNEERLAILRMLSEGKISVEEAEMLLRAVSDTSAERAQAHTTERKSKEVTELFQEIGQEISKAVASVQRSEVGKIVSEVVDEVKGSIFSAMGAMGGTDEEQTITEPLDWTLDGAGVSKIDSQTSNGDISLDGSDRTQVTVYAWKKVRARNQSEAEAFARQVQVHVERHGDAIRIYKEHPKPPEGINVSVRYEIQGPRAIDVALRTANGAIRARGVDGAVDAVTSNGRIELHEVTGRVEVRTSNGQIEATVGLLRNEGIFSTSNGAIDVKIGSGIVPVTATTSNGPIDLALPADFSGQLDAKTSNGRVHSDFPIPVTGEIKNSLAGPIGAGGEATVKLRSSNGSIHLRAQRQVQDVSHAHEKCSEKS